MSNPFDPFDIDVPPFNVYANVGDDLTVVSGSVAAFNDSNVATAVTAIVNRLKSFKGDASFGQLAESTARTFGTIVRNLSLLGV